MLRTTRFEEPKYVCFFDNSSLDIIVNTAKRTRQDAGEKINSYSFEPKRFFFECRYIEWQVNPTKGCLPLKVIFHIRSSSPKGRLPPKAIYYPRTSSAKGRIPLKVVFY